MWLLSNFPSTSTGSFSPIFVLFFHCVKSMLNSSLLKSNLKLKGVEDSYSRISNLDSQVSTTPTLFIISPRMTNDQPSNDLNLRLTEYWVPFQSKPATITSLHKEKQSISSTKGIKYWEPEKRVKRNYKEESRVEKVGPRRRALSQRISELTSEKSWR